MSLLFCPSSQQAGFILFSKAFQESVSSYIQRLRKNFQQKNSVELPENVLEVGTDALGIGSRLQSGSCSEELQTINYYCPAQFSDFSIYSCCK